MEVTVSKRKLNITLLVFLIIIILPFTYFLIKGFPLNWNMYSIDKYSDLAEICLLKEEDNGVVIKCNGFLKSIEYLNNEEVCLSLSLVINDNSEIKDIKICDSTKLVLLNDPELNSEMLVPVEVNLKYKYKIPFIYELESITPKILEDEITLDIRNKLADKGIHLFNVRTREIAQIEKAGYYTQENEKWVENNVVGIITFTKVRIKDIHSTDNGVFLTLEIIINGKERELVVNTEGFTYDYFNNNNVNDLRSVHITKENISEIPLDKSYNGIFIYIPYGRKVDMDSMREYCNGDSVQWKTLCNNLDNIEELQLDKSIDEYVNESLEKLILDSILLNE